MVNVMTDRLIRRPEVQRLTGLSRSSLYEMIAAGKFPAPVRIGERAVAWRESEIREWIEARPPALPAIDLEEVAIDLGGEAAA